MLAGYNQMKIDKANILIVYDNVLKSPDPFILKSIRTKYREEFKDFLDIGFLDSLMDDDALFYITMCRNKKNPLEWLAKKPFDYEKFYEKMKKKNVNLYNNSRPLIQYRAFQNFSKAYCIDKVYVWNPYYDKRQHYDINEVLLEHDNVQYCVSENLIDTINEIGNLNIVYDWDIDRIGEIIKADNNPSIFFGIAAYGFNLNNGILKNGLSEYPNVGSFPVIEDTTKELYVG